MIHLTPLHPDMLPDHTLRGTVQAVKVLLDLMSHKAHPDTIRNLWPQYEMFQVLGKADTLNYIRAYGRVVSDDMQRRGYLPLNIPEPTTPPYPVYVKRNQVMFEYRLLLIDLRGSSQYVDVLCEESPVRLHPLMKSYHTWDNDPEPWETRCVPEPF